MKKVFYIIIMILSEVLSQFLLQKGAQFKKISFKNINLLAGLLFQVVWGFFYFILLKNGWSLAIANALVDGGGALAIVILGWVVFKQKLTLKQLVGVLIIICGGVLLS